MDPEQKAFLDYITQQPWDDETPRLVYADWLEEHDMPEEADRQRKYVGAERWLRAFANDCGSTCTNYSEVWGHGRIEEKYQDITYEMVVQAGHDYINEGEYLTQMGSETARNMMSEETSKEFWKNWSIVTGVKVDWEELNKEDWGIGTAPFFCSC